MKPLSAVKPKDSQFNQIKFKLSEVEHRYGPKVHLLSDPYLLTLLARLCHPDTYQPTINELTSSIYISLLNKVVSCEFPYSIQASDTRMKAAHPEAVFMGPMIHSDTPVISVNLARAGTYPSHVCYNALNYFMNPKQVRQDHISIARQTSQDSQVTGSEISGHKIGGSTDGAIVLFPDPMGATGSTIIEAMRLFKTKGKALKYIALHCIVTPEYLKNVTTHCPELEIYAVRLDRGLSHDKVLASLPGTYWDEEKGLNSNQYIVPGGGGFGEVMNNAYV